LSLFFGLVFCTPAVFAAGTPADVVNGIHAALLNNMKHGKEYGCDGRIKHLQPVLDASFDVSLIAQTVMRRHWSELSEAQRNQLIAALADVVIVVEADLRSGSLSTAAAGQKLGKIVAAWPGSRGCERLRAAGAAIIENESDAELALAGLPRHQAPGAIDPIAMQVRDAIAKGAVGIDEIVRRTGLAVRVVLRALPMIERMQ